MVQAQHITPATRAQLVKTMIHHTGEYGVVTDLSRTHQVSRQTLYAWKAQGIAALEQAFAPSEPPPAPVTRDRAILTLFLEGHNSFRDIQRCLVGLGHGTVSVGTIQGVVAEAQQRALAWFSTHMPPTPRVLALDEIYGNRRDGAYLSIVDAHSGAVWGSWGPLAVDHESWLLLLWEAQAHGLQWEQTISDGGGAIGKACAQGMPEIPHGHDMWHLLHRWGQALHRLRRQHTTLDERTATVQRQADRVAAGGKPIGQHATTDVAAHQDAVQRAADRVADVQYLGHVLHALLAVVIVGVTGLVDVAARRADLDALLALLAEVRDTASGTVQKELAALHTATARVRDRVLVFAERLEAVQQISVATLGMAAVQEIAWAWQRRAVLGWTHADILAAIPTAWRAVAQGLLAAWNDAVRASSQAEVWHSLVRPHLAVHRRLSAGMLALLAVYHNHRVFDRGAHVGKNPLQLSGIADAPTDWLVALGSAPTPGHPVTRIAPLPGTPMALAA
jgi:hypothetical protein